MTLIPTLLIIGTLMLFTAFLCAVETALLACSKARLHQAARGGDLRAINALSLIKKIDEVLVAILIILTIVPVASSALLTSMVLHEFTPAVLPYSTAGLGLAIIFLAEAFPKAVGTRFPEAIALSCAKPLQWCMKLMIPVTFTIRHVNEFLLMLAGLAHHKAPAFTEADLRGAINLGLEHGTLGPIQHRMLDAVLDLNELTVADVMVHRSAVVAFNIATPQADVPQVLGRLNRSRVLVYEGEPENYIGILHVRDYLTALGGVSNRNQVNVKALLRPLYFVPETTPVGHQLLEFLSRHSHLALVVDEYGTLEGLITLEDILEEIVGDITDEHDAARRQAETHEPAADGSLTLRGNMPVRDANRQFGWSLPEENAVTVAGLLVETLGHLPAQGEKVKIGALTLVVAGKRGHRVEKVLVQPEKKNKPKPAAPDAKTLEKPSPKGKK